jgi:hypothetical protein
MLRVSTIIGTHTKGAGSMENPGITNVVLVHGAFVGGSGTTR